MKTTLTNQDKILICKRAINTLNKSYNYGLCVALRRALYECGFYDLFRSPGLHIFPEVLEHKPENCPFPYWFPLNEIGRKKRIEILEAVIIKLTNK